MRRDLVVYRGWEPLARLLSSDTMRRLVFSHDTNVFFLRAMIPLSIWLTTFFRCSTLPRSVRFSVAAYEHGLIGAFLRSTGSCEHAIQHAVLM